MKNSVLYTVLVMVLAFGCTQPKTPKNIEFEVLNTNTDASLRGLFVVDENVVWASGSEGTVLQTVDGGKTWKKTNVPGAEKNDFRSIHAWNEKRAMVFGVAGSDFAYETTDGGDTWNVVYSDTTAGLFFNSLTFANANLGLAVSDPVNGKFFVIRTEDGGKNWERVQELPPVEEGEANFAASNTCIEYLPSGKAWLASGGKAARVFYSDDFGKSWQVAKTPMIRGEAASGIFSIAFKNDKEGVIVGGIYDQPELNTNIAAYTIDGGKNWLPAGTMPKEYRSCVQYVGAENEGFWFAVGKTGCDVSGDGGKSWEFLSGEGYYTFRPVPGQKTGYAAGNNGRIAKVRF